MIFMTTIIDAFQNNVQKLGDRPCLKFKKDGNWQSLSWVETSRQIEKIANGLASIGVVHGSNIGILSNTRYEWVIADMAILSAGAVVVPIYSAIPSNQIADILNETEVEVLFVENKEIFHKIDIICSQVPKLKHVIFFDSAGLNYKGRLNILAIGQLSGPKVERRSPSVDDIASIIYTSGTSGESKGVVMTHANLLAEVTAMQKSFNLGCDDVMLSLLPLAHVLARAVQFYQLAQGFQSAFAESIEKVAENLIEVKPQLVVVVPRFIEKIYEKMSARVEKAGSLRKMLFNWSLLIGVEYNKFIKRKEKPPVALTLKHAFANTVVFNKLKHALGGRIKFIVSGGAPLSEELSKFFHNVGLLILEGYGLTETFAAITVNRLDDFHFGTVGKPLDGVEIRIADDGEILVKGGMVFKSYYKKPEVTKEAFTDDGWYKTGDVGEFSRDGFLRITDRKKDIIVTAGGKNIAPQMIEALLEESKYISHAIVFGDRKRFVSAVLSLNMDFVKRYAENEGISYNAEPDLITHPKIRELIGKEIEEKNKKLSHFETIKKFAILDHDFTIETGELTPTMKVKRRLIEEKYKDILEGLYKE